MSSESANYRKELTEETREELQEAVREDFEEIQVVADTLKECYANSGQTFEDWQVQSMAMQYYTMYTYGSK